VPSPAALRRPAVIAAVLVAAAIAVAFVDRPVIFAVALWPESTVEVFEHVTELGHSTKYIVASALAFALFRWIVRRPRLSSASALIFGAIVLPGLLVNALKILIGRFRPHRLIELQQWGFDPLTIDYNTSSFPSGHSSTIFGLAFALGLLFPSLRVLWFSIAVIVGFSRVAVLAHYPSDVIIGGYIGMLVAASWAGWLQAKGNDWRAAAVR